MSSALTRREAVGVVAAGAASAPAPDRLAYAVIGCGAWGRTLLTYLNRIPGARCAAVCDPDEAARRQAASGSGDRPRAEGDYRRVLEQKDIRAVIVATPLDTHFAIVRDAMLAGKHVHCEPPLVFKPAEIQALREAASRADVVVQTGLQRRYSRFYQLARLMATKGFLGEVTHVQAQWHRAPGWVMNPNRPKEANWKLFREFSGGLAAELGSHQFDLASWIFNDTPEFVTGAGSLDWRKDGRDVFDTAALILRYPDGRQMTWSAISTSRHLPFFGGARSEAGEAVMGTDGTIELTVGTADQPALAMWYYQPSTERVSKAEAAREIERVAGATIAKRPGNRPMPVLLDRDQISGQESFLERELKYSRRWLYSKGIMVPQEDRNPVLAELESFFECCREGRRPKADLEAGLKNAATVMMANLAMDTGRRVTPSDIEKAGRG